MEILKANVEKFNQLKQDCGTHSPSLQMMEYYFGPLWKKPIDACFIRNPLATDLFLSYMVEDIKDTNFFERLVCSYPSQNQQIAEIISNAIAYDFKKIFVGNGATEIIQAVIHKFCNKIVIMLPTFSPYYEFSQDVEYYYLKAENQFQLDVNHYLSFVKASGADSIAIINPNNPTGSFISLGTVEEIIENLQHLSCIILDESFIHFAYDNPHFDFLNHQYIAEKYSNVVLVKSMSKDFGIAGLRAGYALMNPKRVRFLLDSGYLWNSNCFSEYFFKLLAQDNFRESYERIRKKYIRMIIDFYQRVLLINNINVYETFSNFFLIELSKIKSIELTAELYFRYGIYIRACNDKLGLSGEYVRICVGREDENQYVIESLGDLLGHKS